MKKLCLLCCVVTVTLLASDVTAETIEVGPFSVDVQPMLSVRFNKTVLFNGERAAILRSGGFKKNEPSPIGAIEDGQVQRKGNTLTLIAQSGRNVLRREIMVREDELHLTYELQVFGATGGTHIRYELLSPNDSLQGVKYKLTKGLLRRPRITSQQVFDLEKVEPFKYLYQTGLYLVLQDPKLACTIDFNPQGPWLGASNYGESWAASPYHDGENTHFAMLCSSARYGATLTGKMIVRPGDKPYEAFHPNVAVAYTTDFPATLSVNFTDSDTHDRFQMCGAVPRRDKTFGWKKSDDIRIIRRPSGGLLRRDFATSASEGQLELKLRDGLYLLTLNVYDPKQHTGPFTIVDANGALVKDVKVAKGAYYDKTVPLRVRGGLATLRFSGQWKINALTAQLILHDDEDFLFERPHWNMDVE
jgi:hypothetical protein